MLDMPYARARMVERQIARRGIREEAVLQAMREVPREAFIDESLAEFAYEDTPLPIEAGQSISQPYIVARMIEAAEVKPGERVLEIGAGSGYAAAVMSRIAAEVYAIERHEELSRLARGRLKRLGYRNVELRTGDGSEGWPEAAPFDAILVAAGGPAIPQTLQQQLKIGGRLIMPVGQMTGEEQRLMRLRRVAADQYEEEDLGGVKFVPLIGAFGWHDDALPLARGRSLPTGRARLPELIREAAKPLPDVDDPEFGAIADRFAGARVVLLGEASHGTSEFYRARAAITRRLIERHGFCCVAVEADWPDAASFDRYVRRRPAPAHAEPPFRRFPSWMWRNTDVEAFIEWMREWNGSRPREARAAFYGLDLYNLSASIRGVLDYLDQVDKEAARVARERYGCLMPYANNPQSYGRMALTRGYAECQDAVLKTLREMLDHRLEYIAQDGETYLDATANARLIKNAEAFYRAMYYGSAESWNLRDTHMFETLCAILDARGAGAKAVVWAHNSHIGDASKTEMGIMREELNLGQLCRERFGREAVLVGFVTHSWTVACATEWDGPVEVKRVRPSLADSYERLAHDSAVPRFFLDLRQGQHEALRNALLEPRLERFIGVIYRPETERWSHYSACSLPEQFDAYIWFDESKAVQPLPTRERVGAEETYPFGL